MRLRVFGRTNDEKGAQLEELTRRILERLGYKQLALNIVGSGGSEIDVRGEYPIPTPLKTAAVRVIGECKAYESPVGLPDWLKFLGKVYSEEARSPGEVRGLFVALSGVNGNVCGAADELRTHKKTIDLVDGEVLINLVQQEFVAQPLENIAQRARGLTSDPVAEFSLGYYEQSAFWILQFANGTFSILLGKSMNEPPASHLIQLVAAQLQASSYRDLYQEEEHRHRLRDTRKLILSRLLAERGAISRLALLAPEGEFAPAEPDVDAALAALVAEGLIGNSDTEFSLDSTVQDAEVRGRVLRELTDKHAFILAVCSPGWLSLIDEALLREVSNIQGELSIPDPLRSEVISLLRWSPTALAWALRPDQMLVGHRRTPEERRTHEANDLRYFRVQLLRYAVSDFIGGPLAQVHFERLDLREVEFLRRARFKSSTKLELEVEVSERFATARTTPDLGGGVVRVWVHEDAPEPWNWGKTNEPQSVADETTTPSG